MSDQPTPTKFSLPDTFSKPLAAASMRIYTSRLNALAKEGFSTPADLLGKRLAVVRAIKKLVPGDEAGPRMTRRQFLSAIFWVCPGLSDTTNIFYKYYQKNLPLKEGWVARKDYKSSESEEEEAQDKT